MKLAVSSLETGEFRNKKRGLSNSPARLHTVTSGFLGRNQALLRLPANPRLQRRVPKSEITRLQHGFQFPVLSFAMANMVLYLTNQTRTYCPNGQNMHSIVLQSYSFIATHRHTALRAASVYCKVIIDRSKHLGHQTATPTTKQAYITKRCPDIARGMIRLSISIQT